MAKAAQAPPIVVIYGDEDYQKATVLQRALATLLPPEVDRALALVVLDGTQDEEHGGPSFAGIMDDLKTLPFLTDRRVVVVRAADKFITTYRERLERYLAAPSPTATLILECRSFPKTTRLYKAAAAVGGELRECRKLTGRALVGFVNEEARVRGKRIEPAAAQALCELVGADQGILAAEVEKLSLYAGSRAEITAQDVSELVGQTREEKIFRVMDEAGSGRLAEALTLWHQVLSSDPSAVYKCVGGLAFVLRKWLDAQNLRRQGASTRDLATRLMMWGREREAEALLARQPAEKLASLLGGLAELDSQAKIGRRSIETGVEAFLVRVAAPAT